MSLCRAGGGHGGDRARPAFADPTAPLGQGRRAAALLPASASCWESLRNSPVPATSWKPPQSARVCLPAPALCTCAEALRRGRPADGSTEARRDASPLAEALERPRRVLQPSLARLHDHQRSPPGGRPPPPTAVPRQGGMGWGAAGWRACRLSAPDRALSRCGCFPRRWSASWLACKTRIWASCCGISGCYSASSRTP